MSRIRPKNMTECFVEKQDFIWFSCRALFWFLSGQKWVSLRLSWTSPEVASRRGIAGILFRRSLQVCRCVSPSDTCDTLRTTPSWAFLSSQGQSKTIKMCRIFYLNLRSKDYCRGSAWIVACRVLLVGRCECALGTCDTRGAIRRANRCRF